MPQLDPSSFSSQLFWLVASMAVMYAALRWKILPALLGILDAREAAREGDLSRAHAMKEEAEAVKAAYEQAMSEAHRRAQALFAEAEAKNAQALEQSLAALTRESAQQTAQAERKLADAKSAAMQALLPEAAGLASAIVEKLTHMKPERARAEAAVAQAGGR